MDEALANIYHLHKNIKGTDTQIDIIVCCGNIETAQTLAMPELLRHMNAWSASCTTIKQIGTSSSLSYGIVHVGVVSSVDRRDYWSTYPYTGPLRCHIYLVSRSDNPRLGEFTSFVICAASESDARFRHPDGFMHILEGKWFYPRYIDVDDCWTPPPPHWVEPGNVDTLTVTCLGECIDTITPNRVFSAAILS